MVALVDDKVELHPWGGKLVALEGDWDAISTQLLLLPPSQKILVLPSLLDDLSHSPNNDPFDARAFVRHVHTNFTERTETAWAFLQSSTATHPRLVLMNGGSVAARTTCISNICERLTNGDFEAAEAIFDEIVRDGVTGLMGSEKALTEVTLADEPTAEAEEEQEDDNHTPTMEAVGEAEEDISTRAMKAADSLDRETAVLEAEYEQLEAEYMGQEHNLETGSNLRGRAFPDSPGEISERHIIMHTSRLADDIVQTVVTMPSRTVHSNKTQDASSPSLHTTSSNPHSLGLIGEIANADRSQDDDGYGYDEADDQDSISPDDSTVSMPRTPAVIYGEACIVDVQSMLPKEQGLGLRKVKSLGRSYNRDAIAHEYLQLRHVRSAFELRSRPTISGDRDQANFYPQELFQLPRTTFVRASQTTIRKSLPSSGSLRSTTSEPRIRAFIDRGTDAEESHAGLAQFPDSKREIGQLFEPVFGLVEDMIIRFTGGPPNVIFESVLRSYQRGSFQKDHTSYLKSTSSLNTPLARLEIDGLQPQPYITAETDDEGFHGRHEFDPYASHNDYFLNFKQWPGQKNLSMTDSAVQDLEPPTPSATPPPQTSGFNKFLEFASQNRNDAINVQNSFRAFLGLHFPAGQGGYTQHYFSVAPEADRLWKPIWGDEGNNIDQIIALGCEDGVKEDFFSLVSGQIERLGTKRDGFNRSGSVDLRYLISNVMNSFSNPSGAHGIVNPFSNPGLLATLLVPHLEAFLACNTKIHLLILTYPSEHLATVIALRALIGQSVLKIAGVIDSRASDPPSSTPPPQTPSSHLLSNEATPSPPRTPSNRLSYANSTRTVQKQTSSHQLQKSDVAVSFSKADYLLPSIATDAEIANFLSGIWMSLIKKSTFYTPEPEPAPLIVEKIIEKVVEKPRPPPTPTSSHPPVSYRAQQGKESRDSKISRLTGGDTSSSKDRGHHYATSISTIRTTGSERFRRERKNEEEWENFYIGEEDSDDDAYDRMIMGRSGARIIPEAVKQTAGKKRSSKKALKWLGLA